MAFIDDIRTIAKTRELEEKLAKVIKDADAVKKESILGTRIISSQTGDNSKSIKTGSPINDPPISVIPPVGGPVLRPPISGSPSHPIVTVNKAPSDPLSVRDVDRAVKRLSEATGTDLSSKATTNDNPGGSSVGSIARKGAGLPGHSNLRTTLDANGNLTGEEKDSAEGNFISRKAPHDGAKTATDLADNNSETPPPSPGTKVGSSIYGSSQIGEERLTSVIGFDKDGEISPTTGSVFAVRVLLDGSAFPTPSDEDAEADGQLPWDDAGTPPSLSTYTAGFVWKLIYGSVAYYGQTLDALCSAALSGSGLTKAYGYTVATGIITGGPESGLGLLLSGNPSGVPGVTHIGSLGGVAYSYVTSGAIGAGYGQVVCGGAFAAGSSATCALAPPTETAWPLTGTYILSYALGLLTYSPFDSEVPLVRRTDSSTIRLACGDGVNVTDERFIDIELGTSGGFIVSTIAADGTTVLEGKYYSSQGVLLINKIAPGDISDYRPR